MFKNTFLNRSPPATASEYLVLSFFRKGHSKFLLYFFLDKILFTYDQDGEIHLSLIGIMTHYFGNIRKYFKFNAMDVLAM